MNETQKNKLIDLKNEGRSYKEMASALSVSEGTVKSFFSRKKIKDEEIYVVCKNCKIPLDKRSSNKKFCSDLCRYKWWRKNAEGNRKCVTKKENTVVMNATLKIDLKNRKENPSMTNEQFEAEKAYAVRMSIMRTMLKMGLITKSEYDKIDTKFLKKYKPIFGSLYR